MTYRAKTLINGFKLGKEFGGKTFVAVPQQKLTGGPCSVIYGEERMTIPAGEAAAYKESFPDKFGRGTYTLCYYEWKPDSKQTSMF